MELKTFLARELDILRAENAKLAGELANLRAENAALDPALKADDGRRAAEVDALKDEVAKLAGRVASLEQGRRPDAAARRRGQSRLWRSVSCQVFAEAQPCTLGFLRFMWSACWGVVGRSAVRRAHVAVVRGCAARFGLIAGPDRIESIMGIWRSSAIGQRVDPKPSLLGRGLFWACGIAGILLGMSFGARLAVVSAVATWGGALVGIIVFLIGSGIAEDVAAHEERAVAISEFAFRYCCALERAAADRNDGWDIVVAGFREEVSGAEEPKAWR